MLESLKGILSNVAIKNIDNNNKLVNSLVSYFFSANIRGFNTESKEEFLSNVSNKIKIAKKDNKIYLLLSYGFLVNLIDNVYKNKTNTFVQRVTHKSIPDNRVVIHKRKYFLLKDFLLHIFLLSVDNIKEYKKTFNFDAVDDFDYNIHDLDMYINYINSITKTDIELNFLVKEHLLALVKEEVPLVNNFIGESA